jgi:hypothetical protein
VERRIWQSGSEVDEGGRSLWVYRIWSETKQLFYRLIYFLFGQNLMRRLRSYHAMMFIKSKSLNSTSIDMI